VPGSLEAAALETISVKLHDQIYPISVADTFDSHLRRRSYYSCPRRSTSKKVGPRLSRDIRRDILLLRELIDYEDEVEYTYISLSERDACKM
jgi:hypothetical protein